MSTEARTIVDGLTDVEAVRFFQHFGNQVFAGTPRDVILSNVSATATGVAGVEEVITLDPARRQERLSPDDSVTIARTFLRAIADDDGLAPALVQSWQSYEEDRQFVDIILAAGFVAAMLMFMSTTEVEGKVGNWKFRKRPATPELVRTILQPIAKAVNPTSVAPVADRAPTAAPGA